jgi:hypothetical protein
MTIFTYSTYQKLMPESKTFFNAAFLFGMTSGGHVMLATWITHPNEGSYETSDLLFTPINVNGQILESVAGLSVKYPNVISPDLFEFVQRFIIDLNKDKQFAEKLPCFYRYGMFKPIKVVTVTPKEPIHIHTDFFKAKFIHTEWGPLLPNISIPKESNPKSN